MKRIISLLTIFALVMTMLVSCSKPTQSLTATELLNLGEKYLLEMNYEQAIVQFTKLIEVEPKNPRGYLGAAEAYVAIDQPDKAIDVLQQGLKQLPDNADIVAMLNKLTEEQLISETTPTDNSVNNGVFVPETAFSIDGIELGVTDLGVVKGKYSSRSDYNSNLMNDDSEDTVYSQPYIYDDNANNEFGYLFVQPLDSSAITHIVISDSNFVYMGKYHVGDSSADFEQNNTYTDGNKTVSVNIDNGKIKSFSFNCSPTSDTSTSQTGTIKITNVSPTKFVPGQETTFTVEVEYTSTNVGGCIIYAGANTDESDKYMLYDEYILPDIKGKYTFSFACTPTEWTGNSFGIYVNLSEYPHPESWSPLAFDVYDF